MPYRLIETTEPAPVDDGTFWVRKSEMIPMGDSYYQILEAHDGRTFERIIMPDRISWHEREEVNDKEEYAASPVYVIYSRRYPHIWDEDKHQWEEQKEAFWWQLEYRNGAIISSCGKKDFRTVEECNESILRHRHQALSPFVSYPVRYKPAEYAND